MSIPTQIFFGGSDEVNGDYSEIHRRAKSGRTVVWQAMMNSKKGDRVLLYFNHPHSAIIASAEMMEDSWPAEDRPYRGRIGKIRILKDPITFDELTELFPKWDWLRYPRSKVYLDSKMAAILWKRAEGTSSKAYRRWRNVGAGFGDPATNKKVESAAISKVTKFLKKRGYSVLSRESEHVGYDLEATRGDQILHVEVKGVSGQLAKFPITYGELNRAKEDPKFRIYVVTDALQPTAQITSLTGPQLIKRYSMRALSYIASPR